MVILEMGTGPHSWGSLVVPLDSRDGFTLIELLAVIGIMGVLATVAVTQIMSALQRARYAHAIRDLRSYSTEVQLYISNKGHPPSTWAELGMSPPPVDPWGNEYVLNNHDDISPGDRRKDGPTVPINSHFDLFSPGPNGEWVPTIQADSSLDDVVVAGDGTFVGRAEDY